MAGAAPFADIISIIDESGSMSGEQAWMASTIVTLDGKLNGLTPSVGPNQYGLVGFGHANAGGALNYSSTQGPDLLRRVPVGGANYGTAAQFQTAAGGLLINGGLEDGWSGIALANTYAARAGAARNYILVTDEDRDDNDANAGFGNLTFASVRDSMINSGTLLNAIVNASFNCSGGGTGVVLGIDSKGNGYRADGSGGYTTCTGATAGSGAGTTVADYVNLALGTGGAAWDLNILRSGGINATSFTEAFIDIKALEITQQPPGSVPEPGSLALVGVALAALAALRRRRA